MLLTSPFSQLQTEERYGTWIADRLIKQYRAAHPAVYRAAIEYVARFLRDLVEQKDKHPIEVRRAVVKRLVHALDAETKKDLLDIDGIAEVVGVQLRPVLTLKGIHDVELKSFFSCVKAALSGKEATRACKFGKSGHIWLYSGGGYGHLFHCSGKGSAFKAGR